MLFLIPQKLRLNCDSSIYSAEWMHNNWQYTLEQPNQLPPIQLTKAMLEFNLKRPSGKGWILLSYYFDVILQQLTHEMISFEIERTFCTGSSSTKKKEERRVKLQVLFSKVKLQKWKTKKCRHCFQLQWGRVGRSAGQPVLNSVKCCIKKASSSASPVDVEV